MHSYRYLNTVPVVHYECIRVNLLVRYAAELPSLSEHKRLKRVL